MIAASISTEPANGVQEELDGGVDAAVVAPDADQEVHRHQRDFPEHVEQEQVLRDEDADQAEFEQQQEREEFLDAVLDGASRRSARRWASGRSRA